jgi:tetratricopeptide (TPR) repeat protein
MSGKNQKYNKPVQKPVQKGKQPIPKAKVPLLPEYPPWLNYALLGGILIITFWCYHLTLNNQFTNWDDGLYVYENSFIKNLNSANIKMMLFHDYEITHNYYHPLTMLSLALNWHFSGKNPEAYYVTEIILHLINTVLVFFLSLALFKAMVKKGYGKIKYIPYLAGLCALWHGIHPMHVESVSWIAERKDVLYLMFYLLGLLMYVKYIMDNKMSRLIIVFVLFILSLLSKPLAVVFPLVLFTFDVLLKRKPDGRMFLEKIPFFMISIGDGYISYVWAKAGGSISSFHVFTLIQRIVFVGYNYLMYIGKLFLPLKLCSFYPYPEYIENTKVLPFYFYTLPFAAIAFTFLILFFAYKKGENYFRVALFGVFFYFFNVMFILQFISAGPAIMADRYTYASYFGLIFMLVYFIYLLWDKVRTSQIPIAIVVGVFSCWLAYLCEARTAVWHNTETLWKDVIAKYPARVDTVYAGPSKYEIHVHSGGVETAYKNLGNFYVQDMNPPNYDSAYMNYVVLEQINSTDAGVYSNLGNIWAIRGNINKSLEEYTKSLKLDSVSMDTYLDRGITYSRLGKNDLALQDYNHAYKLDSSNQKVMESRGYLFLFGIRDYAAAYKDYNKLIAIDPSPPDYYKYRGLAELNTGRANESITDLNKALNGNPKDKECMYYLSFAYKTLKSYSLAINYALQAQKNGYKLEDGYLEGLQKSAGSNGQ